MRKQVALRIKLPSVAEHYVRDPEPYFIQAA
jgi:hypothetical protein